MFRIKILIFKITNKLFPKLNRVVIIGSNTIESNAVEIANYLDENTDKKVYFLVKEKYIALS